MPEAEQGLNVARIASLRAGIPVSASAVTVNRFCSSGLQAIAFARRADHGRCGATAVVAGGTESMSLVPMGGNKISPNPALVDSYPDVYLSTGLVAENHARESARLARGAGRVCAAQPPARHRGDRGRPVRGRERGGERRSRSDEGPRRDTSLEALAKLEPAFHVTGTVTAGNSSQTSDGAAAVVVMDVEPRAGARACSRSGGSSPSRPPASSPSDSASGRSRRFARRSSRRA